MGNIVCPAFTKTEFRAAPHFYRNQKFITPMLVIREIFVYKYPVNVFHISVVDVFQAVFKM
jgi:hypothetical protein